MAFDDQDCYRVFNVTEENMFSVTYSTADLVFLSVIFPLLFVIGLISNAAFIYVVVHVAYMRTITNYYLISLSISDILFLCSAIGDKLFRHWISPIYNDDIYGSFGCAFVTFVYSVAYFSSIGFVTLVSVERYSAVCRPTQVFSGKVTAKQRARNLILINVTISSVLALTFVPAKIIPVQLCYIWPEYITDMPETSAACLPFNDSLNIYTYGIQTLPFFIAFIFNVYLYARILSELKKRERNIERSENALADSTKRRNQITIMLIVNGVLFFMLLAPFEFMSVVWMISDICQQYILSNTSLSAILADIARSLSYLNSAINVLVYTALSPRYTKAFSDTYCSTCPELNCPTRNNYHRADESNTTNETRTTANL